MGLQNTWASFGIRGKINTILGPALIPIVVIAFVTFNSHRDSSIQSSAKIEQLVVQTEAEAIHNFSSLQSSLFQDWTKEDIFGLAIEFDETSQIKTQFADMLSRAPDFSVLLLINQQGAIIEAASSGKLINANQRLRVGSTIHEATEFRGKTSADVTSAESELLTSLGAENGRCYVYSFPCRNSTGELNGVFLAYLDISVWQQQVENAQKRLRDNGFPDANAVIVDRNSVEVVAHSDKSLIGTPLKAEESFINRLKSNSDFNTAERFVADGTTQFVSCSPIIDPVVLANSKAGVGTGHQLALALFVPEANVLAEVDRIFWFTTITIAVSILMLLGVFWFMSHNISSPLYKVIANLDMNSSSVMKASTKMSERSQQIASGANQQASSLEEISSSLEEMASMTRQNADNAMEANTLADEARKAAEKSNEAMDRMSKVISEIKKSSDQTARIVKTIDEIAFQTNLLALNAAVEAARAGEAGKSFAIVAEEVRSLAQRSAEAARNTSTLIQEAQSNADSGVEEATAVEEILKNIVGSSQKASHLIREVSAASDEQAKGIDQISTAIAEMDKLTQSNASTAESSNISSNRLSDQAKGLQEIVSVISKLVGGNASLRKHSAAQSVSSDPKTRTRRPAEAIKAPGRGKTISSLNGWQNDSEDYAELLKNQGLKPTKDIQTREISPDVIVPLDDEDLKSF